MLKMLLHFFPQLRADWLPVISPCSLLGLRTAPVSPHSYRHLTPKNQTLLHVLDSEPRRSDHHYEVGVFWSLDEKMNA